MATVPGPSVLAALQKGVSPDSAPTSPITDYRKVAAGDGTSYYLGDALTSFVVSGGFPGASGIGAWHVVSVEPLINGGVIQAVKANGLMLEGAPLDLRNVNPAMDTTAGNWTNGGSFAALVIQAVPQRADLMRVCWNVELPPPAAVTGPPGFTPLVRTAPFKRLMCGLYSRDGGGSDVGGYIVDDIAGAVSTYSGSW